MSPEGMDLPTEAGSGSGTKEDPQVKAGKGGEKPSGNFREPQYSQKINKNKYLWITGSPVQTAVILPHEYSSLKEYCRVYNADKHIMYFYDTYFQKLQEKSNNKIRIHVAYCYKSGNSHDEDWENTYYRIKGSRLFDDFLQTIPECEELYYLSNYIYNVNDISSISGSIEGVYCSCGDIRFFLMGIDEGLGLTVPGNDQVAFASVLEVLGFTPDHYLGGSREKWTYFII